MGLAFINHNMVWERWGEMSVQVAQRVPYHSGQCTTCQNYVPAINRCRGFAVESWPKPILAVFGEESSTECSRYRKLSPGGATAEVVETPQKIIPDDSAQIIGRIKDDSTIPPPRAAAPSEVVAKESVKPELEVEIPEEIPTSSPERGQALIHCHKCKAQNSPTAERCQNCAAKLLPAEGIGTRLTVFFSAIFAAGLFGYLIYVWYIKSPGSAPTSPILDNFINPIVLGLAALIALITAITVPLRRTPEYVKYKNRALRHIPLNPWQALDDLESAIEIAPDKEQGNLLKERAKLYEKVGFVEDAARDFLVLATSPERFKSEGEAASMLLGADSEMHAKFRRASEIANILKSGKANAVGFCSKCNDVVVLDQEEHCPQHPKIKGREVAYIIPADELAGKISVMQQMEARNPGIREKLTELLSTGKAAAVGYCTQCHGIVDLDPQRHCRLHIKARIKHIEYALPRGLAAARKKITKSIQGRKASKKLNVGIAIGLAILLIALMLLVDIDLSALFK